MKIPDHLKVVFHQGGMPCSPSAVQDAMLTLSLADRRRVVRTCLSGLLLTQDGWVLTAAHGLGLGLSEGWVVSAPKLGTGHIALDCGYPILHEAQEDFALLKFDMDGPAEPMPLNIRQTSLASGEPITAFGANYHLVTDCVVDRASGRIAPGLIASVVRSRMDLLQSNYGNARAQIIAKTQGVEVGYSGGPVVDARGAVIGITSRTRAILGTQFTGIVPMRLVEEVVRNR